MNKVLVFFIAVVVVHTSGVFAAPVAPIVSKVSQPDGTTFTVRARGDEHFSWIETTDGHTIIKVENIWFYAQRDGQGGIEASDDPVGTLDATQLQQVPLHLAPEHAASTSLLRKYSRLQQPGTSAPVGPNQSSGMQRSVLNIGDRSSEAMTAAHTQYVLTILVDYSDASIVNTDASFQMLMYGGNNSVKDFFEENSYGGLVIVAPVETSGTVNDGIVRVVRPTNHLNQGNDHSVSQSEAREIIALVDPYIDFSTYDTNGNDFISTDELAIVIIAAGYETSYGGEGVALEPGVWGHAWGFTGLSLDGKAVADYTMFGEMHGDATGEHQVTIGIMCHELGHLMLGLPDLYDTKAVGTSDGIGTWGLMGGGSWNSVAGFLGSSPSHLSAWSKVTTNFTVPQDIDSLENTISITSAHLAGDTKRIWADKYKTKEYFLVENRQQSGYDSGLAGAGLMIWHIDDWQDSNEDANHKKVDVEEADGLADLDDYNDFNNGDAGDPFPGISNNMTFNNASNPDSSNYAGGNTEISVTSISAPGDTMTADIAPASGDIGDNVRYDEGGANAFAGIGSLTIWQGMHAQNDTTYSYLDGVDLYISDPIGATVNIFFYDGMAGGEPTGLIHSKENIAASPGWNRLLFNVPQSFPIGTERGLVVKVTNDNYLWPIVLDANGAASGRSYFSGNGVGVFTPFCSYESTCGDVNLVALMGQPASDAGAVFNDGFETVMQD